MSMLRKLSQSSLAACILGNAPTLYRAVGVDLLRWYSVTTSKVKPQKRDSKTAKSAKSVKSIKSTKEKSNKTTKKVSLVPKEPKRPSSPYSIFYGDFFRQQHKDHPEYKVTDIARLAGEQWSKLSEEEKNPYSERHKKSALDFEKNRKKWLDSLTPEQISEENKRRRSVSKEGKKKIRLIKDPRTPKKPRTPYINFVKEHMGPEDERGPNRIKVLASEWKNLTNKEKEPYVKAYEKDKIRYEKEKEEYKNLGKQVY